MNYKEIKTYEDACKQLGIEPVNEELLKANGFSDDEIAYRRIKTVIECLNEGWKPDWTNYSQIKYYPWFWIMTNKNEAKRNDGVLFGGRASDGAPDGFVSAITYYATTNAFADIGSRLCLKSRELAIYIGKQFIYLYIKYLF